MIFAGVAGGALWFPLLLGVVGLAGLFVWRLAEDEPPMPPPEVGRRPLLDENGNPVLDENGNPIYEDEEADAGQFLKTMALVMPWVISLLFHVGLFLIMLAFVFLIEAKSKPEDVIVPDPTLSTDPGGALRVSRAKSQSSSRSATTAKSTVRRPTTSPSKSTSSLNVIGAAGGGSSGGGDMGMSTSGGGGPRLFGVGSGGNVHNVVYVIDRSGSMVDTFESVRQAMYRSIGRLQPSQTFQIILFAKHNPKESFKRLEPATRTNKKKATDFLVSQVVEGETDPVPALKRAFAVLEKVRKKGRLIWLLTDGEFPDNKAVLRAISIWNKKKKVFIYTFLYGTAPPEAESVMRKIAKENNGKYTFVPHND